MYKGNGNRSRKEENTVGELAGKSWYRARGYKAEFGVATDLSFQRHVKWVQEKAEELVARGEAHKIYKELAQYLWY